MKCIMVMALFMWAVFCLADGRSLTKHLEKREVKSSLPSKFLLQGVARSRKRRSTNNIRSYIAFDNRCGEDVKLYYKSKNSKNKEWVFLLVLKKDDFMDMNTFISDKWKASDITGKPLFINSKRKFYPKINTPTTRDLYIITRQKKIHDLDFSVETLVVVDKSVRDLFDSDFKTRTYVETMMDFTAKVFLHESLTRHHLRINLVISQIVTLKKEISFNASRIDNLNVVCPIMNKIEKKEKRTFDHKLFLTRNEFGSGGFARLRSMCDRSLSCSMVKDRGFTSSLTVAHEIAHAFGVNHNEPFVQHSGKIMSKIVDATISDHHWSIISRNTLIRRARQYSCLKEEKKLRNTGRGTVTKNFTYPGEIFSYEDQCDLEYNRNYTACQPDEDIKDCCAILTCYLPGGIYRENIGSPALDGTSCGVNKWCINGKCQLKRQKPKT